MNNTINYILQILTVCQAVWVLTLMGFLIWHYVWRSVKNRFLEKNALTMGVSYSLITVCTMISSLKGFYDWYSLWQIIIILGYAFGDYAIVKMLFHVTRNYKTQQMVKEYIQREKEKKENTKT